MKKIPAERTCLIPENLWGFPFLPSHCKWAHVFVVILLSLLPVFSSAQVSQNMTLLGAWDNNALPSLSGVTFNEVYGWAAPNGREYAILGSLTATYFIEVTNPNAPVLRDSVAGRFAGCIHRDYKTYQHYCYGVGDEGNSSLQVIDMQYLPDSVHVVFDSDVFFVRAHNISIDSISGRLYTSGTNNFGSGTTVLDIGTNPEVPSLLGNYNLGTYTHDMYVRGDTLYMNNGGAGLAVYDFRNLSSPNPIGSLPVYPGQGYNHSSWLTDDGNYLAMCDETWNSPVRMVNVNNLQNMGIVSSFQSQLLAPTGSIPHNPLIAGNYLCLSYYHDGIQIYDISNPSAPIHAAWYDTDLVATNYNGYKGAWGVYPYLPSGTILGSDILNGLFVLRAGFPFPHPLQGNFQVHHASCNGLSNGDATFVVQGGTQLPTGGYTYLWSNGATTATASGLSAGNYSVTATDRHGFTIVQSVQITQPAAIVPNLSSSPESCPGNADGTLSVNPSGGASNFSYVWSTGDMIATLNGLTAGIYTCTITDGVGCQAVVSGTVGLVGPVPLAFAGQDTAICNTTYLLNAQAQSGAQAFWSPGTGSGQIANPNAAQTLVTGLAPGPNTFIWVVNGNPCANTDTISIYVSAASQVSAGPDTLVCGNSLQLLGSNPLMGTGSWSSNGPSVNFSDPNDPNAVVQGLTPGTYGLVWTVTDMGCTRSDTQLVTVTPAVAAAYSFGGSGFVVNFSDNSVNATTWLWDFGDGATSSLQNPSHTYTQSGSFTACLIAGNVCGMDTLCRSLSIGSVGIAPREAYQFTVFPNPTFGNIWLQPSMDCDNVVIRMVDMQGRQCLRQELGRIDAQGEAEIDLSGMAKGMYLLEIDHDGETQRRVFLRW